MLAVAPSLGIETLFPVKPHETVYVTGGGGSIQQVPWNLPPDGDVHFGDFGQAALTDEAKNQLAQQIKTAADGALLNDVRAIFATISDAGTRSDVAVRAITLGANATIVNQALASVGEADAFKDAFKVSKPVAIFWSIASTASFAASVYHGYKRNDSIGWALWWGFMGALFPIVTPTIALAQGFGKPKHRAGFGHGRRFSRNHRAPKYFRRRA